MRITSDSMEFLPGIFIHRLRLPIPNSPLEYVNAYVVDGDRDNGALLVDTGWNTEEAFDALKKQLVEIGISGEDISQMVVTHAHPDHYGLAGELKHLYGARLALHHLEKDFIESRYINMDELIQEIGRWLHRNGAPPDELSKLQTASLPMLKFVTPVLPDVTLYGGETITTGYFNFQVLWTPGHAPGHICLYEPDKKILFSGDHILPTITPHVGLHPQSSGNPLGDYLDSLNRLKQLDVKLVLPGHEHPFTNFKPRIEEIIQHHKQRNSEILSALNANTKTAYQIATEITWMHDVIGVSWDKLDSWDKRMAVLETLSHLEAMRATGKLDKFTKDDIIYYRIPG
jgi:glyoxylase-like metal-dependent hydrolase (beta-lactamase superfamily II)